MPTLAAFFESARLPVMSEVARALVRTLNEEGATAGEVQKIIAQDPALTANLLRQANSASFGLSRQVESLDRAIAVLGMSQVRALALSTSFRGSFPVVEGLSRVGFWKFSMACAAYAQWLAKRAALNGQQAWLIGMMLRLGELLIGQRSPELLAEIEALPHRAHVRWEREQHLLGFDEGQVTAVLARRWNFPEAIVEALQSAGNPMVAKPFDGLGAAVHLAALLADSPHAPQAAVDELPQDVILALALDRQWMVANFPGKESFLDVSGS